MAEVRSIMESNQELALKNANQTLKNEFKKMEELYASQDEESRQLIQELKDEQKELLYKVRDMEKKLFELTTEKTDLAQQLEVLTTSMTVTNGRHSKSDFDPNYSNRETAPETFLSHSTYNLSDSIAQEYDELHEKIDVLEDEKSQLLDKVKEYLNQVRTLIQEIEDRDRICSDQKYTIEKLDDECNQLRKENKELHITLVDLSTKMDKWEINMSITKLDQGMSLFEELEQAGLKEEDLGFSESGSFTDEFDYPEVADALPSINGTPLLVEMETKLEEVNNQLQHYRDNCHQLQQYQSECKILEAKCVEQENVINDLQLKNNRLSQKCHDLQQNTAEIESNVSLWFCAILVLLLIYVVVATKYEFPVFFFIPSNCFSFETVSKDGQPPPM